jgi:hypothetical protein
VQDQDQQVRFEAFIDGIRTCESHATMSRYTVLTVHLNVL